MCWLWSSVILYMTLTFELDFYFNHILTLYTVAFSCHSQKLLYIICLYLYEIGSVSSSVSLKIHFLTLY